MPINRQHVFNMIYEGRTAVLLGGDLELYEGMRTNIEIIQDLVESCNYPPAFPLSLPEVGEYFAELNGKSQLIERITNLVDTVPGESPLLNTLALIKNIQDIFTTTLDERIQGYFPQNELIVIRSDKDSPRIFSRSRRLYKLNGSIVDSAHMIATKTDLIKKLSTSTRSPIISHLAYNLTFRVL